MVTITLNNLIPNTAPANGWIVKYRIKGSTGAYITPVGSPYSTFPIIFSTTDPAGTLYEGTIETDCGGGSTGAIYNWSTPCNCTDSTYSPSPDGSQCEKTVSIAATVTNSGYCLTSNGVGNGAYTNYGSRIYNPGFSFTTIFLSPGSSDPYIYGNMPSFSQWSNTGDLTNVGPMNREAVWIDSDCNGTKDSLMAGVKTTIATQFNNTGGTRTIFVGIGGDNQFKLVVNGTTIIDTGSTVSTLQFKIWHIIPVTIVPGINYINAVATGDGTVNDAIAMVIYDNTAAQIYMATDDSQLNILFKSSSLNGTTYDVATCPSGYSLDTSGGSGSYLCKQVLTEACNT